MRKVFISYRHKKSADIKKELLDINTKYNLFIDKSVDSGDIPDYLSDEAIRRRIRDEKLKDTTVTLFIHDVGAEKRKFIDWELAGSMIDYNQSYKNAIIIINLNGYAMSAKNTNSSDVAIDFSDFKTILKDDSSSIKYWKRKLPYAPERLLKNMAKTDVQINVIKWADVVKNPILLKNLIEKVAKTRKENNYDTSIPLMRRNL